MMIIVIDTNAILSALTPSPRSLLPEIFDLGGG